MRQDRQGTSFEIRKHVVRINSQEVIDGCQQILGDNRPLARVFSLGIGGSNDLAHLHATSLHECTTGLSPVITAGHSVEVANR